MAAGEGWNPEKMLQIYVHDYMLKKNFHKTAQIFAREADVGNTPVVISGFLSEWWSVFYDVYSSRQLNMNRNETEYSAKDMMTTAVRLPNFSAIGSPMEEQRQPQFPPMVDSRNSLAMAQAYGLVSGTTQNLRLRNANKMTALSPSPNIASSSQQQIKQQIPQPYGIEKSNSSSFLNPTLYGMPKGMPPRSSSYIPAVKNEVNPVTLRGWPLIVNGQGFGDVEDVKVVEENVDSVMSGDDGISNGTKRSKMPFGNPSKSSADGNGNRPTGCSLEEVGCFNSSISKVLCCNFSSNGLFLASGGHDRKVLIWNIDTLVSASATEDHGSIITDVRFRPGSTIFATSSFDKTVKVWDSSKPSKSLIKLVGHNEQVMSLDFHPRKSDLLCSCDNNGEVRIWNINCNTCTRVTKGADRQLRFQPLIGKLLAAAGETGINVMDVESDRTLFNLKGHAGVVRSICWDVSGKYIASVSEDSVRVWSIAMGGRCMHELHSSGGKFESCVFHPRHPLALVIGGYQLLDVWNPGEDGKIMSIRAHSGMISALADSAQNKLIASASHDHLVKLWK